MVYLYTSCFCIVVNYIPEKVGNQNAHATDFNVRPHNPNQPAESAEI